MEPADSATEADLASAADADLVNAVCSGSPAALAELYDRFSPMLMGLAQRILGNGADAEEVLQETFLQVWNQAGRYDPHRSSVSTWLVLITRSRSIDRLRSQRVKDRTLLAVRQQRPADHTSPKGTADVFRQERRQRLQEEMARLPAEQREILVLAFFEGLTQSEIAARTDTPLGTVKTRSLLAMKKLRKALREEVEELL